MRIHGEYGYLLQRLLSKAPEEADKKTPAPLPAKQDREHLETSSLVRKLKAFVEGEEKSFPTDTARLEALAEQIARGTYRVDPRALAEAMLEDGEDG